MSNKLIEGLDYIVDPRTKKAIFTKYYLTNRGYCCENACKNCPYGFEKQETSSFKVLYIEGEENK